MSIWGIGDTSGLIQSIFPCRCMWIRSLAYSSKVSICSTVLPSVWVVVEPVGLLLRVHLRFNSYTDWYPYSFPLLLAILPDQNLNRLFAGFLVLDKILGIVAAYRMHKTLIPFYAVSIYLATAWYSGTLISPYLYLLYW